MWRLCELACQYSFLDLCHVDQEMGDVFPMLWRFFPTLDPGVDVVMSRDLDSRFTAREAAAVREWLASDKTLHAMRDHPWHGVSIMGGGWGSKLDTKERRQRCINSITLHYPTLVFLRTPISSSPELDTYVQLYSTGGRTAGGG